MTPYLLSSLKIFSKEKWNLPQKLKWETIIENLLNLKKFIVFPLILY